jgi:hypothetical protein
MRPEQDDLLISQWLSMSHQPATCSNTTEKQSATFSNSTLQQVPSTTFFNSTVQKQALNSNPSTFHSQEPSKPTIFFQDTMHVQEPTLFVARKKARKTRSPPAAQSRENFPPPPLQPNNTIHLTWLVVTLTWGLIMFYLGLKMHFYSSSS